MQDKTISKAVREQDPIWKWLNVELTGGVLWLAFTLFYLFYIYFVTPHLWQQSLYFIFLAIFNLLSSILSLVSGIKERQCWQEVRELRQQALQDPTQFRANVQPIQHGQPLHLPAEIRLVHNRSWVIATLIILLITLIIGSIGGFYMFTHQSESNREATPWLLMTIFGGGLFVIFLVTGIINYFFTGRYQPQSITLDDEGIATTFKHQQSNLRWQDARIFAHYKRGTAYNQKQKEIFELSNEQTVVRWAKQGSREFTLKLESNVPGANDYNWLLGQVNALIMERTGLALLNFNERMPVKAKEGQPTETNQAPLPQLAQEDPIKQLLDWNPTKIISTALIFFFAIGMSVAGIQTMLNMHGTLGSLAGTLLLIGGVLFFLLAVFLLLVRSLLKRFLFPLWTRRKQAAQDPQHWLASEQPQPSKAQPQPAMLTVGIRRSRLFWLTTIMGTILYAVIGEIVFRQAGILLLLIIGVSFLIAMLIAIAPVVARRNRDGQRIEVSSNGLTARLATSENHLNWQEARLFTRYKGFQINKNKPAKIHVYELVGEHGIVRWQWSHKPQRWSRTIPPTSKEEYDRWMEQLAGYVVERTGLPLLDLDQHK